MSIPVPSSPLLLNQGDFQAQFKKLAQAHTQSFQFSQNNKGLRVSFDALISSSLEQITLSDKQAVIDPKRTAKRTIDRSEPRAAEFTKAPRKQAKNNKRLQEKVPVPAERKIEEPAAPKKAKEANKLEPATNQRADDIQTATEPPLRQKKSSAPGLYNPLNEELIAPHNLATPTAQTTERVTINRTALTAQDRILNALPADQTKSAVIKGEKTASIPGQTDQHQHLPAGTQLSALTPADPAVKESAIIIDQKTKIDPLINGQTIAETATSANLDGLVLAETASKTEAITAPQGHNPLPVINPDKPTKAQATLTRNTELDKATGQQLNLKSDGQQLLDRPIATLNNKATLEPPIDAALHLPTAHLADNLSPFPKTEVGVKLPPIKASQGETAFLQPTTAASFGDIAKPDRPVNNTSVTEKATNSLGSASLRGHSDTLRGRVTSNQILQTPHGGLGTTSNQKAAVQLNKDISNFAKLQSTLKVSTASNAGQIFDGLHSVNTQGVASGGLGTERQNKLGQILAKHGLSKPQAAAHIGQTLGVEITQKIKQNIKRFEIRLDPPELGRLDVRLDFARDGSTQAHIRVERIETFDLLTKDRASLERALGNAGFDMKEQNLSFSHGQQARQDHEFSQHNSTGLKTDEDKSEPEPQTKTIIAHQSLTLSDGIDLQL